MIVGDLVDAGLAEIRTGPFGTQLKASDYVEAGRPVLNVRNVGFGDVRSDKLEHVDEDTAQRLSGHLLEDGDIVFGRKGAVERHAFITDAFVGAMQGSDCIRLRLSADAPVRPQFASFALRTREHQAWMQAFCSHGATMASLNQDILRQISLPDLPLSAQDAVIAVLGSTEDLIQNNSRRVELLGEMARVIYREWFVRFRYPGHENVPLVDSPLGPTPDGWTTSPLRDLVTTQYGYTESATTELIGPHFLRGMDINKRSYIDWATVPYCAIDDGERQKYEVQQGDVFVIRMADPGKVGICEVDVDAVFASYLVRLRPIDNQIDPYFLFFTLCDDAYQGWVTGASSGATRRSVSAKVMTEPSIVVPSLGHQALFRSRVEPLRSELSALVEQNSRIAAIRDLLLPKLVSGAIDVSSLDLEVAGATV